MAKNRINSLISEKYIGRRVKRIIVEEIKHCVYFISDGEFVKIGHAESLFGRIKQLQIGNARKLRALFVISVNNKTEAQILESKLHEKFEDYKVRGEWFRLEEKFIEYELLKAGCDLRIPVSKFDIGFENLSFT